MWIRLCAICILASSFQSTAYAEDGELVFGLIPALSPAAMVRRYQPLATHLTNEIGVPVRLVGAPDYETYMNRVLEGSSYDMIITGGDFYRLAERRTGYRAIARVDGPGVQAIIVAAEDGNFATLDELPNNVRIASIGVFSLMHRLGTQTLRAHGVVIGENATLVPAPTLNAAMLAVLSNQADIAIIAAPFFERIEPSIRGRIAILAESELAPHHPISLHVDVPEDISIRLTEVLLALADTPEGRAALDAMNFPRFIVPEPGLYEVMDWAADDIETQLGLDSN